MSNYRDRPCGVVLDLAGLGNVPTQLRYIADQYTVNADRSLLYNLAEQIDEQTKPPRIPEPRLWGIVRASRQFSDGKGIETMWALFDDGRWHSMEGLSAEWSDLIAPVLIRKGVE